MPEALMIPLDTFDLRRVRRSSSKREVINKKVQYSLQWVYNRLCECQNFEALIDLRLVHVN